MTHMLTHFDQNTLDLNLEDKERLDHFRPMYVALPVPEALLYFRSGHVLD